MGEITEKEQRNHQKVTQQRTTVGQGKTKFTFPPLERGKELAGTACRYSKQNISQRDFGKQDVTIAEPVTKKPPP
jgi:hypothetical protein